MMSVDEKFFFAKHHSVFFFRALVPLTSCSTWWVTMAVLPNQDVNKHLKFSCLYFSSCCNPETAGKYLMEWVVQSLPLSNCLSGLLLLW
jgi:hypothetical protein